MYTKLFTFVTFLAVTSALPANVDKLPGYLQSLKQINNDPLAAEAFKQQIIELLSAGSVQNPTIPVATPIGNVIQEQESDLAGHQVAVNNPSATLVIDENISADSVQVPVSIANPVFIVPEENEFNALNHESVISQTQDLTSPSTSSIELNFKIKLEIVTNGIAVNAVSQESSEPQPGNALVMPSLPIAPVVDAVRVVNI